MPLVRESSGGSAVRALGRTLRAVGAVGVGGALGVALPLARGLRCVVGRRSACGVRVLRDGVDEDDRRRRRRRPSSFRSAAAPSRRPGLAGWGPSRSARPMPFGGPAGRLAERRRRGAASTSGAWKSTAMPGGGLGRLPLGRSRPHPRPPWTRCRPPVSPRPGASRRTSCSRACASPSWPGRVTPRRRPWGRSRRLRPGDCGLRRGCGRLLGGSPGPGGLRPPVPRSVPRRVPRRTGPKARRPSCSPACAGPSWPAAPGRHPGQGPARWSAGQWARCRASRVSPVIPGCRPHLAAPLGGGCRRAPGRAPAESRGRASVLALPVAWRAALCWRRRRPGPGPEGSATVPDSSSSSPCAMRVTWGGDAGARSATA